MATKWLYEFFTDTTNAMSIEERIKETVANFGTEGIVFPDGECCSTEDELRSLLIKKGIVDDGKSKGRWIGKISTIVLLIVCSMFVACGSKGASTDTAVQQYKVWNYKNINGAYEATLHSTNYYSTNKNENLYLNITLHSSEYGVVGGFSWFVYGTPENEAGTVMKFSPTVDNMIISFNNGENEIWRGAPSESGLTFAIGRLGDFIERLKKSTTCTVVLDTEMGQMRYTFDTKNLQWN